MDEWGRIAEILWPDGASEYYHYDYAGNIIDSADGEATPPAMCTGPTASCYA